MEVRGHSVQQAEKETGEKSLERHRDAFHVQSVHVPFFFPSLSSAFAPDVKR